MTERKGLRTGESGFVTGKWSVARFENDRSTLATVTKPAFPFCPGGPLLLRWGAFGDGDAVDDPLDEDDLNVDAAGDVGQEFGDDVADGVGSE